MNKSLNLLTFLAGLTLIASFAAHAADEGEPATGELQQKVPLLEGISPDTSADGKAGNTYTAKRKVVFTQFDATNVVQLDDISNPYDGLPRFIAKQLETDDGFSVDYVNGFLPKFGDPLKQDSIVRIAREARAQFLVSGIVLYAGIMEHKGYLGTSIGSRASRYFVIELSIYDGQTGSKLKSLRLEKDVQGDVGIGRDKPIGSNRFGMTESGRVLNELMGEAATNIASIIRGPTPPSEHSKMVHL